MSSCRLDKKTSERLKRHASIAAIGVASFLSLLKLFAFLASGSLSVLSSVIDSLSDVLGSVITFIAVKYSMRPASDLHRYGYGKAEAISALLQAFFIACSGLYVIYDAVIRFFHPRILDDTPLAIIIMVISLICTFVLILYQKHIANLTQSQAINADSAHYIVDILTNLSIILSLGVVKFFDFYWFDTLTAAGIAIYLLFSAVSLCKDSFMLLLDHELDDDIRQNLKDIIKQHPFVHGVHDIRTRSLGNEYMLELHLELDGRLSLYEAHHLSDKVESSILQVYPNAQIIIHQDPAGIDEERLDQKLVQTAKRKSLHQPNKKIP